MAPTIQLKYRTTTRKPFPWRWFGVGIVFFSISLIVVLALLNVLLVGYDVVPTVVHDYKSQILDPWWLKHKSLARLVDKPGECDPVFFHEGEVFQTNVGLFDYQIVQIPPENNDNPDHVSALQYSAQSLSNCTAREVTLRADYVSREARLIAMIYCSQPFYSIIRTRVTASDIDDLDDILQGVLHPHYNGRTPTTKSLDAFLTVSETLYFLTHDLFAGWWSAGPATVTYSAKQLCGADPDTYENIFPSDCGLSPYELSNERLIKVDSDGRNAALYGDGVNAFGPITNQTLAVLVEPARNLAQAFIHAIHVDLGNWVLNNIFTNETALRATVNPANSVSSVLANPDPTQNILLRPMCDLCVDVIQTQSFASQIMQNVTNFYLPVTNYTRSGSVIHVDYICPNFKLKTADSLLATVFNSTYSMFMTAWTCIMIVAVFFAERTERKERISASGNANNQELESGGGSPPGTHSSTHHEKRTTITHEHVGSALEWVGAAFEHED